MFKLQALHIMLIRSALSIPLAALALCALSAVLAPESAKASALGNDCVVKQFVAARNVVQLEPQQAGVSFPANAERIFAFARLDCTRVASNELYWFRWMKDGREVTRTKARLDVGRNWRIWSQARISPGAWSVMLVDGSGRVQVEAKFEITPVEPSEAPAATSADTPAQRSD